MRGDLGITYDEDVLRLIDIFRGMGLYVGSVVLTQYSGQGAADAFLHRLEDPGHPLLPALSHRRLPLRRRPTSSATRAWGKTTTSRPATPSSW